MDEESEVKTVSLRGKQAFVKSHAVDISVKTLFVGQAAAQSQPSDQSSSPLVQGDPETFF